MGLVASVRSVDLAPALAASALFYPALMLNRRANTFSEVLAASVFLVALAPLAMTLARLPVLQRQGASIRITVTPVALLLPCAVAVALALRAEPLDFSGH